jgi:hypothetical protein
MASGEVKLGTEPLTRAFEKFTRVKFGMSEITPPTVAASIIHSVEARLSWYWTGWDCQE